MLGHICKRLLVVRAAHFSWALLPMLLVAAAVFAVAAPWGARALRSLDPVLDARRGVGRSLSVYEPSRMEIVDGAIGLLGHGRQDVFVDIGSGDGRFVLAAARAGASAVGIEQQEALVLRATDNARMAGVASRATFLHADALTLPSVVSQATVVTMFLTPDGLEVLVPWLEGVLRRGTRVVSHTWPVPGWRPLRVVLVEDAEGRVWPIYEYRVPAADAYAARVHRGASCRHGGSGAAARRDPDETPNDHHASWGGRCRRGIGPSSRCRRVSTLPSR